MIISCTQAAVTVSITRYEDRYLSRQQAARVVSILSDAFDVESIHDQSLARDFLNGNLSANELCIKWTGKPAVLGVYIDFLDWFSESSDSPTFNPKGSFIAHSKTSLPLCNRSVVFTTKRFETVDDYLKTVSVHRLKSVS